MSLSSLSNTLNAIELNDVVPLIGNEIGNNSITAPRSDGAYQLPILSYDDENKFIYHRDNLLTLFRRLYLKLSSLKNFKIPIAVVSMMGKSRIGKSLLANLLIRFLERNCDSDWMRAEDDLLKGFSFGGGKRVITRGILMWSEPFIIDTPKGKIVVLVMDTEGLYEVNTQENYEIMATIAMICFLISSTQIYNFKESFHSEEIKYLKTITDRFIYEFKQTRENKTKLCQNMAFIMRDWPDVISYPDPIQDGRKYLEEQTSEDFNELKETVDKLGVFLMSHPGKLIATEQLPNFQYRYNIFEPLFLSQVNELGRWLINEEILSPFAINKRPLYIKDMFLFINTCIEVAIRGCPDVNRCPRGIDVNIAAASFCKKIYLENMRKFVENNWQIFRRVMETKHEEFKNYSINRYHDLTYLRGDESQYQPYEQQIIDSMEKYFISLKKARTKKEALVLIGTIVAFAGVAGVCIRVFLGIAACGGAASGEAAVAGATAAVGGEASVVGATIARFGGVSSVVGATVASAGGVSSVAGAIKTGVSLYEKYIEIKKLNFEDNQLSDTLPQTPSSLTEFTVIEDSLIHIQNLTQSSVNVNINYNNNNNNFYTLR